MKSVLDISETALEEILSECMKDVNYLKVQNKLTEEKHESMEA